MFFQREIYNKQSWFVTAEVWKDFLKPLLRSSTIIYYVAGIFNEMNVPSKRKDIHHFQEKTGH